MILLILEGEDIMAKTRKVRKKKKKKKRLAKQRAQKRKGQQKKAERYKQEDNIPYVPMPGISEIDPPPGFRPVSSSQAILEYAKPVVSLHEKGELKDLNDALNLSMLLWNFSIDQENPDMDSDQDREEIIKQIKSILKLNTQESTEFLDMMVKRKKYLFPKKIQSENPMIMFIRKETSYLITKFDYDSLNVSEEPYPLDSADERLVQAIKQIDKDIEEPLDYEEYEDNYFEMEEKCREGFKKWLTFKGVDKYSEDFSSNIQIYLNFIYRYMLVDSINLKTVSGMYIEEFFADHLLRKVMVEPTEYVQWPPAMKLFYDFLHEIGYLERPEKFIKLIDEFEPKFLKILRKRYS